MQTLWIKNQALWAAAMTRAAQELPRWTAAFWRLTKEVYQRAGGTLVEGEDWSPEEMEN
jgi:hypothetical protein